MMAPTLAFSADGLELAIGAAGGTRLRTALVGVLGSVLHEGLEPQAAIDRPRFHPAEGVVNAEPGVDEEWLDDARETRTRRAPVACAPPLLRRRQRGRASGGRRRSSAERRSSDAA